LPKLTDPVCRRAPLKATPHKLFDEHGLYLQINRNGSRLWRWRYAFAGREKLIALGAYPEVGLAEARRLRDLHRHALRAGRDPGAERQAHKLLARRATAREFETIARDWHARKALAWVPSHAKDVLSGLEHDVFPYLGRTDIDAIDAPAVLAVLRKIEARQARATAHRVRGHIARIFDFALAAGIGRGNPARIVGGALEPEIRRRQPALIELQGLCAMLRSAEAQPCSVVIQGALRFMALTAARPGNVRHATWDSIEDGNLPTWRVPAAEMKARREWTTPLPGAALDVLRALAPLTGRGRYIFPNSRNPAAPLSENAVGQLLQRAGYRGQHCSHGFRASFSSIMNEKHPADHDAIEAQLAHTVVGVRGAYLRAPFLERRGELLAEWGAMLMDGGALDARTLLAPRQ
jgi:integrase